MEQNNSQQDFTQQLLRLKSLLDSGAITQEEFERMKKQIVDANAAPEAPLPPRQPSANATNAPQTSSSKKYINVLWVLIGLIVIGGIIASRLSKANPAPSTVVTQQQQRQTPAAASQPVAATQPAAPAPSAVDPAEREMLAAVAGRWKYIDSETLGDDFQWIETHLTIAKDKTYRGETSIHAMAANGSGEFKMETVRFSGTYSLMAVNILTWVFPDEENIKFDYAIQPGEDREQYTKLVQYIKEAITATLCYEEGGSQLGEFERE